jgi:hypothetical protein
MRKGAVALVIPAQAGIQRVTRRRRRNKGMLSNYDIDWIPACAGMTI